MKKVLVYLCLITMAGCTEYHNQGFPENNNMNKDEAYQIWEDYYKNIKNRRLAEAKIFTNTLANDGITSKSVLALDFVLFCKNHDNAKNLGNQLSENYTITLELDRNSNYWFIKGTTRPSGITLSADVHIDWVDFMCDVAQSYHGIFTQWSLTDPKSKKTWSNEEIETEFD